MREIVTVRCPISTTSFAPGYFIGSSVEEIVQYRDFLIELLSPSKSFLVSSITLRSAVIINIAYLLNRCASFLSLSPANGKVREI